MLYTKYTHIYIYYILPVLRAYTVFDGNYPTMKLFNIYIETEYIIRTCIYVFCVCALYFLLWNPPTDYYMPPRPVYAIRSGEETINKYYNIIVYIRKSATKVIMSHSLPGSRDTCWFWAKRMMRVPYFYFCSIHMYTRWVHEKVLRFLSINNSFCRKLGLAGT